MREKPRCWSARSASCRRRNAVSVIEGDQETDHDARRIRPPAAARCRSTPAPAATSTPPWSRAASSSSTRRCTRCHDRERRQPRLPGPLRPGRTRKVVIVSVTEGEDKPLKYPHMFRAAELLVVNKIDLLPYVHSTSAGWKMPRASQPASPRAAAVRDTRRWHGPMVQLVARLGGRRAHHRGLRPITPQPQPQPQLPCGFCSGWPFFRPLESGPRNSSAAPGPFMSSAGGWPEPCRVPAAPCLSRSRARQSCRSGAWYWDVPWETSSAYRDPTGHGPTMDETLNRIGPVMRRVQTTPSKQRTAGTRHRRAGRGKSGCCRANPGIWSLPVVHGFALRFLENKRWRPLPLMTRKTGFRLSPWSR